MDGKKYKVVQVLAVSDNWVIGKDNGLPWPKIKEDFDRFKSITIGNGVVMGRKTYDSILASLKKPLPKRRNCVVTNNPASVQPHPDVFAGSLEECITKAAEVSPRVCIAGGGVIYRLTLPMTDVLEVTHVHGVYDGDTTYPEIDRKIWVPTSELSNLENDPPFTFSTYERRDALWGQGS